MSINLLFKKINDQVLKEDYVGAMFILKDTWLKYPKNTKIFEEIKKLKKRKPLQLNTSLNQNKIDNFFAIHDAGKTISVIYDLQLLYEKDTQDFYVLNLLGVFNGLIKNYKNAIKYQELSIKINPFDPGNYLNLSLSLEKEGNINLALSIIEIAKLLDYNNTKIDLQLARLYFKQGNYLSSNLIYKNLFELDRSDFQTNIEYTKSLIYSNKVEEALILLNTIKFNKHEEDKILVLKGLGFFKLNQFIRSKEIILSALKINKKNDDAYSLLGSIHEQLGSIDKAIESYFQATKLNKKNHIAFNNLAACYSFIGAINLSISTYKQAIKINPLYFKAIYSLGQLQIYKGQFNEGWLNFEARWKTSDYVHKYLETTKPLYKKIENNHLKILAWNEQGIGDQVMYGSMFNELSDLTSKLSIKIDPRLINVFKKNHPKINFVSSKSFINENEYDYHIPFGNIGKYLRLKKENFLKPKFPYISGANETKKFILNKYKEEQSLLVGISWSSANKILSNHKSLALETLSPVLKIKNIKFISLEFKKSSDEIELIRKKYDIEILKEDSIDNFNDIEGVCSIIDACDFIISCSNTNAHLSGALNKKTYLLLPMGKGRLWNWTSNNGYSLWYPKTKIIKQNIPGDWNDSINFLKKEIINNEFKTY